MKSATHTFFIIFIFCQGLLYPQQHMPLNIDSMVGIAGKEDLAEYLAYANDTNKIKFLQKYTRKYFQGDREFGKKGAQEVLKLSKQFSFEKGIVAYYLLEGANNDIAGKNDVGLLYYDSAIVLGTRIKNFSGVASAYNNMGNAYSNLGNYKNAITFYFKSLQIALKIKDERGQSRAYGNLSRVYYIMSDYTAAMKYAEQDLVITAKTKDQHHLGIAYGNVALPAGKLGKRDVEMRNLYAALAIFTNTGDKFAEASVYNNIGAHFTATRQYDSSLVYYKKGNDLYVAMESLEGQVQTYNNLCQGYCFTGNYRLAVACGEKSLAICKKYGLQRDLMQAYEYLAIAYKGVNNLAKAYDFSTKYNTLRDSLLTKENMSQIAEMQAKYENEKLTREKAEVTNKNLHLSNDNLTQKEKNSNLRFIFILCIAGLALVFVIIFFLIRQKQARVLAEQKKNEEKARINAILSSEENERSRIARELHDGLGQLLSTARLNAAALEDSVDKEDEPLLQNTLRLIDQSVTEVRSVSHNLMPQMLMEKGLTEAVNELIGTVNASKAFNITFNHEAFNAQLTKSVEVAIYRVIQEVLNNMIKHSTANQIEIRLINLENDLKVLISDNGKGFDTSLIEKSEGLGWKNILTRLSLINGKFGVDSNPGQGTTVNIEVAL